MDLDTPSEVENGGLYGAFEGTGENIIGDIKFHHDGKNETDISTKRPKNWPTPVNATFGELFFLSSFQFAYGYIFGSMGLSIIPCESELLSPTYQSLSQGILLCSCGVSQLICPIVGKVSDMWRSNQIYGRRKPFLRTGCLISGIGVAGMYITSKYMESFIMYNVSLFIGMIGFNTIQSVQNGLAPDLLTEKNIDSVSAVVAGLGLFGSSMGFISLMFTSDWDFHFIYPIYFILVVVTVLITDHTCTSIQRRMDNGGYIERHETEFVVEEDETVINARGRFDWPVCPWVNPQCTWRELSKAFTVSRNENADFFWVFISRTFYYVGVSVQTFIQPFLRDVAYVLNVADQRFKVAAIALSAQSVAAVVALSMGHYLKSHEASKRVIIYLAAAVMCIVYVCFALVPMVNPYGFEWLMFVSLGYGVGNGCFLAVDYAIAIAVIEKEKAAEMLGVWGVSSFIGAAIGPILFGFLIQVGGSSLSDLFTGIIYTSPEDVIEEAVESKIHYEYQGYLFMLVGGCLATGLAGYYIRNVKAKI